MSAIEMFDKLGFKLYSSNESFLIYKFETDYDEMYVHFNLGIKTYTVYWNRFVDNSNMVFVPMEKRPLEIKHSSYYGHWQAEIYSEISVKLHNAIHQQITELGWKNGRV